MPKTVTQRLSALEQKLFSDMERGVLRYKRLRAIEDRFDEIERSLQRHQARVDHLKEGVQYYRDRFNFRVIDAIRCDKARKRDACAHCFGRFLGIAFLLVLAGFSIYGIGHALGWVS